MPTYSRISVAVSPAEEMQIKQQAKSKNLSMSAYCKEKIMGEPEQPLSRVTIEYEIDQLKKEISQMNENIYTLSKELLRQSRLNAELSNAFILLALTGAEDKQLEIYETAEEKSKKYIDELFPQDTKK